MSGPCLADSDSVALAQNGSGDLVATTRIHDTYPGLITTTRGIAARKEEFVAGWTPFGPSDEQLSTFQFHPNQGLVGLFSGVSMAFQCPAETVPRKVGITYQAGLQLAYVTGGNPYSQATGVLCRSFDGGAWVAVAEASIGGPESKLARWHLMAYESLTIADTAVHSVGLQLFGQAGAFGQGSNIMAQWSARRSITLEI